MNISSRRVSGPAGQGMPDFIPVQSFQYSFPYRGKGIAHADLIISHSFVTLSDDFFHLDTSCMCGASFKDVMVSFRYMAVRRSER